MGGKSLRAAPFGYAAFPVDLRPHKPENRGNSTGAQQTRRKEYVGRLSPLLGWAGTRAPARLNGARR